MLSFSCKLAALHASSNAVLHFSIWWPLWSVKQDKSKKKIPSPFLEIHYLFFHKDEAELRRSFYIFHIAHCKRIKVFQMQRKTFKRIDLVDVEIENLQQGKEEKRMIIYSFHYYLNNFQLEIF